MAKLSSKDVKIVLSNVEPEHYFKAKNGNVVKNLVELAEAIELMDKATFDHHISDGRNDFASWVKDIIGDSELAALLKKLNSKEKMIIAIEERLGEIQKLEMKLREEEIVPSQKQILRQPSLAVSRESNVKEYLYGLIIGVIVGVLIGLLI
jgi:chromosome segregation ATPase